MDTQTPTQHPLREDPASQRLISPLQFYDPLLVLLKVKLRLNDWWIITGWGILVVVSTFLWEIWSSAFAFTSFQLLALNASLLILMGTYLFLPSAMADLLNRLWENGVIGKGQADTAGSLPYLEFVEQQARWMHSRWWAAIALLVAAFNLLFGFSHPEIWRNAPLWVELLITFITFVADYALFLVFAWLVMIAVATRRLFHAFTIRVKPLHPDGSGGLGVFNRLLWTSIPLVVIASCTASLWGSSASPGRILDLGDLLIYLLVASLPLSAWLLWPHQAMVEARNKLLQPLTDEYERALGETMSGALGDTAAINEGTERLVTLRKRNEEVCNSFPTWPIEILQLRGLLTLLILPILLALLPLLVDLFTKK